jgi:hypothetical protein
VCRSNGRVLSLVYLMMQYPDGKEFSQQELKVRAAALHPSAAPISVFCTLLQHSCMCALCHLVSVSFAVLVFSRKSRQGLHLTELLRNHECRGLPCSAPCSVFHVPTLPDGSNSTQYVRFLRVCKCDNSPQAVVQSAVWCLLCRGLLCCRC